MLGLFSEELIFGGAYYWKEFCVSKWVGLVNKTATTYSPWAYIWEGLLSEGYLPLIIIIFIQEAPLTNVVFREVLKIKMMAST